MHQQQLCASAFETALLDLSPATTASSNGAQYSLVHPSRIEPFRSPAWKNTWFFVRSIAVSSLPP